MDKMQWPGFCWMHAYSVISYFVTDNMYKQLSLYLILLCSTLFVDLLQDKYQFKLFKIFNSAVNDKRNASSQIYILLLVILYVAWSVQQTSSSVNSVWNMTDLNVCRGWFYVSWLMDCFHVLFWKPMCNYCVWIGCQVSSSPLLTAYSAQQPLSRHFCHALELNILPAGVM